MIVAKPLEAALDTAKRGEPGTHPLERHAKREAARNRGERVHHVMQPRNGQLDFAEHLVIELDLEDRPAALGPDVHRQQSRVARMNAVPDDLRGARRHQTVRARIVGTEHDGARWRRELFERPVDVREIGVDVEVIRLDVRDDGDSRREREEGSVVLVGLDDEQSIRAIAKVAAPAANATADDAGGLERGRLQRLGGHDRRRGLPVRSGDGHEIATTHGFPQRLGTADHWNSELACTLKLGVRLRQCRGHHDSARAIDVRRIVAGADGDSEPTEVTGWITRRVAAGDGCAAPDEQLGQCAHAGAGYSDEVNRAAIGGVDEGHVGGRNMTRINEQSESLEFQGDRLGGGLEFERL